MEEAVCSLFLNNLALITDPRRTQPIVYSTKEKMEAVDVSSQKKFGNKLLTWLHNENEKHYISNTYSFSHFKVVSSIDWNFIPIYHLEPSK